MMVRKTLQVEMLLFLFTMMHVLRAHTSQMSPNMLIFAGVYSPMAKLVLPRLLRPLMPHM